MTFVLETVNAQNPIDGLMANMLNHPKQNVRGGPSADTSAPEAAYPTHMVRPAVLNYVASTSLQRNGVAPCDKGFKRPQGEITMIRCEDGNIQNQGGNLLNVISLDRHGVSAIQ